MSTLPLREVTAKIREGGMGDTKRDRDVALKAVPQAFTKDCNHAGG